MDEEKREVLQHFLRELFALTQDASDLEARIKALKDDIWSEYRKGNDILDDNKS